MYVKEIYTFIYCYIGTVSVDTSTSLLASKVVNCLHLILTVSLSTLMGVVKFDSNQRRQYVYIIIAMDTNDVINTSTKSLAHLISVIRGTE